MCSFGPEKERRSSKAQRLVQVLCSVLECDPSAFDLRTWLNELFSLGIASYLCTTGDVIIDDFEEFRTINNKLVISVSEVVVHRRESLLALKDEMADLLMTLVQMIVDTLPPFDYLRTVFTDVMFHVSVESKVTPKCLEVRGLTNVSETSVDGGDFGDIWMATLGDKLVALKTPRTITDKEKMHRNLCREALLWRQLHHPHILTFLSLSNHFPHSPAIVSLWMKNGTILQFVKNRPNVRRHEMLYQIAKGLAYLHQHSPPIVHQDIRCANILVDENERVVLADFGLSRLDSTYFNTLTSSLEHGCIRWLAPELLFPAAESEFPTPSWASDIWVFGMLVLELFTEKPPFVNTATDSAVIINIYQGRLPLRPAGEALKGVGFSDGLWDNVQACWNKEPTKRPQAHVLADDIRNSVSKSNTSASVSKLHSFGVRSKAAKVVGGAHGTSIQPLIHPLRYSDFSIRIMHARLHSVLGPNGSNKNALEALHRVRIIAYPSLDGSFTLLSCIGEHEGAVRAKMELQKIVEFHERFGDATCI